MSVLAAREVAPADGAAAVPTRSSVSGAVLAMTLCAGALIASEFLPVSLLTPVASDLHLTEGQAGQAISVSGIFAVLTSLFVSAAVGRLDRRTVLLGFAILMIAFRQRSSSPSHRTSTC